MACITHRKINYTKCSNENYIYPKANFKFRNKRSGGIIIDNKNNKVLY